MRTPRTDESPPGAAPDPDATLIGRLKQGDRDAAEALVRRYLRPAFAVALAVLANRHDAEDAAQDAFVTALGRIDECREPGKFAGWLMTIVRNRARNLRDAAPARRAVPWDDDALPESARAGDPREDAARHEVAERLLRALATVPEVQRQVVLLHDLEGWRHAEIGDALGLSEGMSRQHLFAAHRVLRERLGADGPGATACPGREARGGGSDG